MNITNKQHLDSYMYTNIDSEIILQIFIVTTKIGILLQNTNTLIKDLLQLTMDCK